jgi:uncharacterized membrane protein YphA (DoxX/SURF4 family)
MTRVIRDVVHYETLYLRLGLAAGFLSAASDRLGIWGPYGTPHVAWGDWSHFLAYTARLNPELPAAVIPALGVFVTAAEILTGLALLLGWQTRRFANLAGLLLLLFAIGMTIGTGVKSALDASVFAASGGAFLLATARSLPWSIDALRGGSIDPDETGAR